jgi:hypothetical protein
MRESELGGGFERCDAGRVLGPVPRRLSLARLRIGSAGASDHGACLV